METNGGMIWPLKWCYRCKTAVDGSILEMLWMIDVLLSTEVDGYSRVAIAFWRAFSWRVSLAPILSFDMVTSEINMTLC
jgi:hypothetical protein